ncbi:MAG: hypothetical protein LUD22_03905, partial [Coprobacillus sp.]|nr:hypothetical protein [Coprobacillus sp.]
AIKTYNQVRKRIAIRSGTIQCILLIHVMTILIINTIKRSGMVIMHKKIGKTLEKIKKTISIIVKPNEIEQTTNKKGYFAYCFFSLDLPLSCPIILKYHIVLYKAKIENTPQEIYNLTYGRNL